ncbi:MAG TPA: lipid-A-disaccharide synthase [Saprospiraceae bacterium]|nr:lipid-A-disaccharide synthase [Saprospiraceae bacterium]
MKYYILSGEASGDLHGSNLVKQIRSLDQDAEIRAWGGDLMEAAGAKIVKHYKDLAFMGFVEVIQNIRTIHRNFKLCKEDLLHFKPHALILIDYPGFNLRIAEWAKKNGFRIFYYISPQLWAWKPGRVKIIRSCVEQLFTILPFENEFYKKYQVFPEYVGHPLLESTGSFKPDKMIAEELKGKKVLALLPGSRKQEITRILPVLLRALDAFPEYTPVIAAAPAQPLSLYEGIANDQGKAGIRIFHHHTYSILSLASLAWVSSGTATLETALFRVPQVVCYAGNPLSYHIAKRLIRVKYISLVNLILDYPLLPELIQHDLTPDKLIDATQKLDPALIAKEYGKLHDLLQPANASARVAASIINKLQFKA